VQNSIRNELNLDFPIKIQVAVIDLAVKHMPVTLLDSRIKMIIDCVNDPVYS
jgi:hypothetical protein